MKLYKTPSNSGLFLLNLLPSIHLDAKNVFGRSDYINVLNNYFLKQYFL